MTSLAAGADVSRWNGRNKKAGPVRWPNRRKSGRRATEWLAIGGEGKNSGPSIGQVAYFVAALVQSGLYVLSGEVVSVTDGREKILRAGYAAGFPAEDTNGHCL